MNYRHLLRYLVPEPVQVSGRERWRAALAAFLAILTVGTISHGYFDHHTLPWLAAPMGASAVILFALPSSPLAQPWPFVGSHLIAATVGVACLLWVGDPVWAAALALSLSILLMYMAHAMHPPGGASALLPIITSEYVHDVGFSFVLYPIGLNVGVMVIMAIVLNRWLLKRRYPVPPFEPHDEVHHHADPRAMERAGITYDDLHGALADMDVYLDVNEEQLTQIYKRAGIHAMRRRMGEMNCEQIMSKDVVVIHREAGIDKAWDLLQFHRLRVLPVVDNDRTLVGIISALDVLSGVNRRRVLARERSVWQRLRRVFSTKGMEWRVEDVMTEKVVTVSKNTHIADIVPLLSEGGYHHLPVVDEQQRLVGMVTQSDLIATLHAGLVAA